MQYTIRNVAVRLDAALRSSARRMGKSLNEVTLEALALGAIVVGELRAGFAAGTQGPRNEAVLQRFLLKPGVAILYADEQTTHDYANV